MAAEPYSQVIQKLTALADGGGTKEQAIETARASGWDWNELRAAHGAATGETAVAPFVQGATFGFSDEIGGAIDAGIRTMRGEGSFGDLYTQERDRNRAVLKRSQSDHPIVAPVTELAGSLATGGLLAPAGVGSTALRTVGKSALLGAGEGAVLGAGKAPDMASVPEEAAKSGLVGGAIGAAVPAGVEAGKGLLRGAQASLRPEAAATADLRRATLRDQTTPSDLASRTAQLASQNPAATIADAGGENVKGLLERVANTPGAGRQTVKPFLEQRQFQQFDRIAADLKGLTGSTRTVREAMEQSVQAQKAAAAPLYAQARSFAAERDPGIVQVWQDVTSRGWGGWLLTTPAMRRNLESEFGVKDIAQAPLMDVIDAWKKTADDQVSSALRKGDKNLARNVKADIDKVLSAVDQANPAYAQARAAWAGPARYQDALEAGRDILKTNQSADEMAAAFRAMSASEQQAYRTGAVSALLSQMGSASAKLPDLTRKLGSREMRAKIAAIMPDQAKAEQWARNLELEAEMSALTARSLYNSATPRRLAEQEDRSGLGQFVTDLAADIATGTPLMGVVRSVIQGARGKMRDTLRSRTDQKLADILTSTDAAQMLSQIQKAKAPPVGYGQPGRLGPALTAPAATLSAGMAVTPPMTEAEKEAHRKLWEGFNAGQGGATSLR